LSIQQKIEQTGVSPTHFRHALGHFCSGVTVVTAIHLGKLVGMTCQSFFSLSIDPPLVALSPSKASTSYPGIRKAGAFCINILASDQAQLCLGFSRSGTDKWCDVAWLLGPNGSPILEGVQAWIDCQLEAEHEAGDHYIAVGRVIDLQVHDRRPLLYYRGNFETIEG
jgi:3-hydroxy-9,10-secoandrosta-1,3,5(10)-triene-9,17-dione monooxygenase reductase component